MPLSVVSIGHSVAYTLVTVVKAARYLRVSPQRVRVLLKSGRLSGVLIGSAPGRRRTWKVQFPPVVRGGLRGPRMGQKPPLRKYDNTLCHDEKEAGKTLPHGQKPA